MCVCVPTKLARKSWPRLWTVAWTVPWPIHMIRVGAVKAAADEEKEKGRNVMYG